jgi:hypothetical protein
MSLQPGVGYSFRSSGSGTTLDINQVWTAPQSESSNITPEGGGEIVIQDGENSGTVGVLVAKMRVIIQDRWEGIGYDLTTAEYAIKGIYAYPTGSKTAGTDATSIFCDNGSKYALANAANGGTDNWLVCLIRQPMNKIGQLLGPQLVIMAPDSDAYAKTTPWGESDTTDCIRLHNLATQSDLVVDGVSNSYISNITSNPYQYNYNCQRVIVANIYWTGTAWTVKQQLVGPVTLPNVVQFFGTYVIPSGDPSPPTAWPQYSSKSDDWNGAWSGYTKASTYVSEPVSPPGFPG